MKRFYILALGIGLLLGACSKDYLDVQPNRFISKDDIDEISKTSGHLQTATLNGLYANMVRVGSGGTTGHDDFGHKGYDIYTDMLSGNVVLNRAIYGWYRNVARLNASQNYSGTEIYRSWVFYYAMIRGANNVIDPLGGNDVVPVDAEKKLAMGQAKVLRAFAYYNLMVLYTKGYDANEKILPVYLEAGKVAKPSKPTKEVFDQMIKDLTEGISLLDGFNSNNKVINQDAAKSYLAYVYAAMGTPDALVKAEALSLEVMNSTRPLTSKKALTGGFNSISEPSWIWGASLGLENNLDLVSWWGQMDVFTYSYAAVGDTKGMDSDLYASISNNDIRKQQFENNVASYGSNAYLPINKFYAPGRKLQGQRLIVTSYIYLRVDEMYLLHIEVLAAQKKDMEAKLALKEFLKTRLVDSTVDAPIDVNAELAYIDGLSDQSLKDEIFRQQNVEFWGEGKSLAALKRGKFMMKRGANNPYETNSQIPFDDPRLTFRVPQTEILNNPVYNN